MFSLIVNSVKAAAVSITSFLTSSIRFIDDYVLPVVTLSGLALGVFYVNRHLDAPEFANEYIIVMEEFESEAEAQKRLDQLLGVSRLIAASAPNCTVLEEDWIGIARSLDDKGKWILAMDKVPRDGSISDVHREIRDMHDGRFGSRLTRHCESLKDNDNSQLIKDNLEYLNSKFPKLDRDQRPTSYHDRSKPYPTYYSTKTYESLYGFRLENWS